MKKHNNQQHGRRQNTQTGRYRYKSRMIKFVVSVFLCCLCTKVFGGSLYTFDKNLVQINALSWIQSRAGDLAQAGLKTDRIWTKLDKSGNLIATVYFTYKTENKYGFNYVCVKINGNGELLGFDQDIKIYKGKFNYYKPDHPFCKNL